MRNAVPYTGTTDRTQPARRDRVATLRYRLPNPGDCVYNASSHRTALRSLSMLRKEQNDLLTQTGPGTPMGQLFRCYWLPALLAEELPENECPPVRVKLLSERLLAFRDTEGRYGADRRVLRPPRRLAVVRPQRGERPALPLSRLEIRHDRPVHRGAVGAGRERLLPEDQAEVLSAGEARRRAVDLYGPAGEAAAAAGVGVRHGAGRADASSPSGCRSATGCRRWKAASIPATSRSCTRGDLEHRSAVQGRQGQPVQSGRHAAACSRWSRAPAASTSARAATPRTATTTGASPSG